jgi:hypothetical protein
LAAALTIMADFLPRQSIGEIDADQAHPLRGVPQA